jgi:hypothetical protein
MTLDPHLTLAKAQSVERDLRYLTSKIDVLANPDHPKFDEYSDLCQALLNFRVTALTAPEGTLAGIPVGVHDRIYLDAMGEGVSSLLGLVTSLCMADGHVFLIEEPENDVHPEGLKVLLEKIVEKSANNQFIVTTHSNIVTRYLGAARAARVLEVVLDYKRGRIPTSAIRDVAPSAEARIAVLRDLGYELHDFDLWNGWLIVEEASAEVIIRNYLIPWFALSRGSLPAFPEYVHSPQVEPAGWSRRSRISGDCFCLPTSNRNIESGRGWSLTATRREST